VNTAYVSASPEGFDNVFEDRDDHKVNLFQPGIMIDKTGDSTGKVGDPVSYTITVTNTSSDDTPDMVARITDAMLGIDETVTLGFEGVYVINETYIVQTGDSDPLVNTAYVSASPEGFDNVFEDRDDHKVNLFQPGIMIDKTGDSTGKVGDPVSYTITVTNTSSDDTPDMVAHITDAMLGIDQTVTLGFKGVYVINETYIVQTGDPDPLVNTAYVSASPEGFDNVFEDWDDHKVNLFQPGIEITKVGDRTIATVGETINYTITVKNTSSLDTPDLIGTVTDSLFGTIDPALVFAAGDSDKVYNVSYTVQSGDPDPLVNVVTVVVSPDGFPNVLRAEARWEVELILYQDETAWGYLPDKASTFDEVNPKLKNWGWTNGPLAMGETYVLKLYADAGGNDIISGIFVGEVTVEYTTGGVIYVTYETDASTNPLGEAYEITDAHLWVGETELPQFKERITNAPGKFPDDGWYVDSGQYFYEFEITGVTGDVYVAAHTVVSVPIK
ncbi:MAG: hypothetical protein U9Q80_07875, partial [Bacillota bacterium]|nr:hypothetical protein [Bacillota bacterium]